VKAKELIDKIRKTGRTPTVYSGRFMYGKRCIACRAEIEDDGRSLPKSGMIVDSLGMGRIFYWPKVEAPQWFIDEQKA